MGDIIMAELVIYGRDGGGMCSHFKSQLDREGIEWRMVSCDDDAGNQEMWKKCSEAGISGSVGLPIVDVYGKTMMRPTVQDVKDRMKYKGMPVPKAPAPAPAPRRSNAGSSGVQVEIPAGAYPGAQMRVSINGKTVTVVIPEGAKPGDMMTVDPNQDDPAPSQG